MTMNNRKFFGKIAVCGFADRIYFEVVRIFKVLRQGDGDMRAKNLTPSSLA
jgi:hypothetical protein